MFISVSDLRWMDEQRRRVVPHPSSAAAAAARDAAAPATAGSDAPLDGPAGAVPRTGARRPALAGGVDGAA